MQLPIHGLLRFTGKVGMTSQGLSDLGAAATYYDALVSGIGLKEVVSNDESETADQERLCCTNPESPLSTLTNQPTLMVSGIPR